MDKAERERKLVALIKEGEKAKTLTHFLDEFMDFSNSNALNDLLNTTKDPNTIQADLRATNRLVKYIKTIVTYGEMAETKLEEIKNG